MKVRGVSALYLLFLVVPAFAASVRGPRTTFSEKLKAAIQRHLDQRPVVAGIWFVGRDLTWRPAEACDAEIEARLKILVKAGLLSIANRSRTTIAYALTAKGRRYVHARGVVGTSSSGAKVYGYTVDEGRTVVTHIDSYTGRENGAICRVWFFAKNVPCDWVEPFVSREAKYTNVGRSAPGEAELVSSDGIWNVRSLLVFWPEVQVFEHPFGACRP